MNQDDEDVAIMYIGESHRLMVPLAMKGLRTCAQCLLKTTKGERSTINLKLMNMMKSLSMSFDCQQCVRGDSKTVFSG